MNKVRCFLAPIFLCISFTNLLYAQTICTPMNGTELKDDIENGTCGVIKLDNKVYVVNSPIIISRSVDIIGFSDPIKTEIKMATNPSYSSIFEFVNCEDCDVKIEYIKVQNSGLIELKSDGDSLEIINNKFLDDTLGKAVIHHPYSEDVIAQFPNECAVNGCGGGQFIFNAETSLDCNGGFDYPAPADLITFKEINISGNHFENSRCAYLQLVHTDVLIFNNNKVDNAIGYVLRAGQVYKNCLNGNEVYIYYRDTQGDVFFNNNVIDGLVPINKTGHILLAHAEDNIFYRGNNIANVYRANEVHCLYWASGNVEISANYFENIESGKAMFEDKGVQGEYVLNVYGNYFDQSATTNNAALFGLKSVPYANIVGNEFVGLKQMALLVKTLNPSESSCTSGDPQTGTPICLPKKVRFENNIIRNFDGKIIVQANQFGGSSDGANLIVKSNTVFNQMGGTFLRLLPLDGSSTYNGMDQIIPKAEFSFNTIEVATSNGAYQSILLGYGGAGGLIEQLDVNCNTQYGGKFLGNCFDNIDLNVLKLGSNNLINLSGASDPECDMKFYYFRNIPVLTNLDCTGIQCEDDDFLFCDLEYGFEIIIDNNDVTLVNTFSDCGTDFEYYWSHGEITTDPHIKNLPVGRNCVDIQPINNPECEDCHLVLCFVIEGESCAGLFDFTIDEISSDCGDSSGELHINGSDIDGICGLTNQISYRWSNGVTGASNINLFPGIYCVTATLDSASPDCGDSCYVVKCEVVNSVDPRDDVEAVIKNICSASEIPDPGEIEIYVNGFLADEFNFIDAVWNDGVEAVHRYGLTIPGKYCVEAKLISTSCFVYECFDIYEDCPFDYKLTHQSDFENEIYSIYPNPSRNLIRVQPNVQLKELVIYNTNGNLVKEIKPSTGEIDISYLTSGLYYLRALTIDGKQILKKFVKL